MSSDEFDPLLVVLNSVGESVAIDRNPGESGDSTVTTTLSEDDDYTIWATSQTGDATGAYTLTLEKTAERDIQQDPETIDYGETVVGTIDNDDGRDPRYEKLAEDVEFEGDEGDSIEISMTSDPIDCYLVLEGPDGEAVGEDDDGGEGLNSLLRTTLSQSGTHTIWAASYSGRDTGLFELTLTEN